MLVIGHRGAMGHAPENTLASVEVAIGLGVDAVEIDVHLVESELVVIHDDRLDRTTNGSGPLSSTTFEELRALDAGAGERIPTLDEVLEVVDGRVGINVELKGPGTARPTVKALERHRDAWRDRVVVSSFDHDMLREVSRAAPELRLGALVRSASRSPVRDATELGAYAVHPPAAIVDTALVADAHAAGLHVFPFTVDEAQEFARLRSLGVDGVFTNYPDRAGPRTHAGGRFPPPR